MFKKYERLIAWRYLRSPKQEGFVSVIAVFSFLGIMLGVATLIIVMAVMNGFRAELLNKLIGMRGHIMIHGVHQPVDQNDPFINKLSSVPNVQMVLPLIEKQAILTVKSQARGVGVHAMHLDDLRKRDILTKKILSGSIDSLAKDDYLLIGSRLANIMFIKVGDRVTMMIPNGYQTAFGSMPKQKVFTVGGIFEIGMHEFDKNIIIIPIQAAQDLFNLPSQLTHIEIFANEIEKVESITKNIQKILPPSVMIFDWRHSDSSIFHAVEIEKNVMFIILTLIILIAAFNIISSLMMLVKDKTKDIAILRTFGASQSGILKIFLLTGAAIGISGAICGLVLGISFALNIEKIRQFLQKLLGVELFNAEIYFLSKLPAKIIWSEVITVSCMAIFLSLLATFYPAWRASRLDPIDAIRL